MAGLSGESTAGLGQPCTPDRPSLGAAAGSEGEASTSSRHLAGPGGPRWGLRRSGCEPTAAREWRCSRRAHASSVRSPTGSHLPRLLRCSQDGDLPTLISSVHRSRHLVMPEHQSRCEFQRGGVEVGLGAAGEEPGQGGGEDGAARAMAAPRKDGRPTALPASLLIGSGCRRHPQQPWRAAREASGGGGRRRGRLSPGALCDGNCVNPGQPGGGQTEGGGGGSAGVGVGWPRPQGQMEAGQSGRAGLTEAQRCTPGSGSWTGRDTLCTHGVPTDPTEQGAPGGKGTTP